VFPENGLSPADRQAPRGGALLPGLAELGIDAGQGLCDALFEYSALLQKWNRSYNLTAIDAPERIITEHFLDCLSVTPYLRGSVFLDVGTGGGFPGLVLALARPAGKWVLLDSNIKKIRFVTQVCMSLKLDRVEVVHARVDQYRRDQGFDLIISRAFASVLDFYHQSRHLLSRQGRLLAMKSAHCQAEIADLEKAGLEYRVHALSVPGLYKGRRLIEILPAIKKRMPARLSL